jgi:hypothetical protein
MYRELAPKLKANGWSAIIPVENPGKATFIKGWQHYNRCPPTEENIVNWGEKFPNAGVGLAAGPDHVIGIDIDILDPVKADQAYNITCKTLGETPLVRVGRAPKKLMLYAHHGLEVSRKNYGCYEVFLKSGQFVLFGTHPDTKKPYSWLDANPMEVGPRDAPLVRQEHIDNFLEAMNTIVPAATGKKKRYAHNPLFSEWIEKLGQEESVNHAVFLAVGSLKLCRQGVRHDTMLAIVAALVKLAIPPDQFQTSILAAYLSIHDKREHSAAARDLQAAIDWGINKFWQGRMPNPQALGNITGDW